MKKSRLSISSFFLNWLKNEMQPENEYLLCVARCLQKLLRRDEFRLAFQRLNGILRIVRLLMCSEIKQQAQYQFAFCIWLLSMNVELAKKLKEWVLNTFLFSFIINFRRILKTLFVICWKFSKIILFMGNYERHFMLVKNFVIKNLWILNRVLH